jgi:hypothetical protein
VADRLQGVLDHYLPINVRAVTVIAPRPFEEVVYPPDADLQDSFFDNHPEIERYDGPMDEAAAAVPAWLVLRSNTGGHVSADPASLATLTRRTFFLPPS